MRPLWNGLLRSTERHPDRVAIEVDGRAWTYAQWLDAAAALAATLADLRDDSPWVALLARRSTTAYLAVSAISMAGKGYLPLSPTAPRARTTAMLDIAGAGLVVLDAAGEAVIPDLVGRGHTFVVPHREPTDLRERFPADTFVGPSSWRPASGWQPPSPSEAAHLLFTSGSTGVPKGVHVSPANVRAFLDAALDRYDLGHADRFSQLFELGFDLSVFDLLAAWEVGGCVVAPEPRDLLAPAAYVVAGRLTVWFSSPSQASLMSRLGSLAPGVFPDLRWSLFCGEALPADLAAVWARAAPSSRVENLYGPTEVTVACTAHRWTPDRSEAIVPIGAPLAGTKARILGRDLRDVPAGDVGELWLGGSQVAVGYWRDPERTDAAFRTLDDGHRWYRTGDLARWPTGDPLHFVGRVDHQLKVRGHRVEPGEVEAALGSLAGARVIVVGWPVGATGADTLVAFVEHPEVDAPALRTRLREILPEVMVPARILAVPTFPLTPNGKVDRAALAATLPGPPRIRVAPG